MMKPVISVIIGTHNQKERLRKVLESLADQTLSCDLYEIIVVDSASTDGTAEMIHHHTLLHPLRYIQQENLGRTGARNRGIQEAQGEIIFFTDADMVADSQLLEEHLHFHNRYKNAAAEGLTYNLKSLANFKAPSNLSPYIKAPLKPLQKIKWAYFLTGNLSVPKKLLQKAGLFDCRFQGYGWEDLELGYRLFQKGAPLYYLPSAVNYHYHLVSAKDMDQRKYHMGQSAALFYQKHPRPEIKIFLGLNPLALFIYHLINRSKKLQEFIFQRHLKNRFWKYLWEEYLYRKGFFEKV